jgi:hypothetical protein
MTDPHHVLFPDDPSPLAKWRRDNERREQEIAAEREREERSERRTESRQVVLLRGEIENLRGQLAELRTEMDQQREFSIEVFGTALGQYGDKIHDYVDAAMKRLETSLWTAIERRHAEVSARLDLLPDGKSRKDFKFANEKSAEVDSEPTVDLPNWRRNGTVVN